MATMAESSRPVLTLKRKSDSQNTSRPVLTINKKPTSTAKPKPAKTSQGDSVRVNEPPAVPQAKTIKEPIPPLIGPRLPNAKMRQFLSMYKLIDHWPHIFDAKKPQPLAVGIHLAIMEDAERKGIEISEWEVKTGLVFYTRREAYLKSLIHCEHRIDIHGNKVDEITVNQKEDADKKIYNQIIKPIVARKRKQKAK